jgi:NADH-quinone oxidoreductase subunit N
VIAVLLRLLAGVPGFGGDGAVLAGVLAALAVATMFGGNLLALLQTDMKRLLAYSSVAHIGYLFVAMAAGGVTGGEAVVFYVITYVVTTLGAFGAVAVLSADADVDVDDLDAYRGLGRRRPGLAVVLGVMLLSLAGIPPTGGFLAKFAVLSAAVAAGRTGLAVAMAVASSIAIFYYLRILVVMFMEPVAEGDDATQATAHTGVSPPAALGSTVALAALVLIILAIGVYPEPWLQAVGTAMASLTGG